MDSLKSSIIFVWVAILFVGLCAGASTVQQTDVQRQAQQDNALGIIPELVLRVQQILIKYGCPYQDPDGVCSPNSTNCRDVISAGVCILSACEKKSDADRVTVADLLAQIGNIGYNCELTGEILLRAAGFTNAQTTLHSRHWIWLWAPAFGALLATHRFRRALV